MDDEEDNLVAAFVERALELRQLDAQLNDFLGSCCAHVCDELLAVGDG